MRFKAVLVDLDGVCYIGDTPIPGALEALQRLRGSELAVRFLTNTTRTPQPRLLDKLHSMGIAAEPPELITPAAAARQIIEREKLDPLLLVHPGLLEDFADLAPGGAEAVVVGDAGDAITYDTLNQAYRALERGAAFLALANNRSFRDADGELSLDAGPFVAALSYASRREATVLGKPAAGMFSAALAGTGCAPEDAVMIGDDVESDVGGAMASGLGGVLVRTGKYRPGVEKLITPPPSQVCADLAEAVDWILTS